MTHIYLSTACWHEQNDEKPELHASCRASCKWCSGSCACPNHPTQDTTERPPHWVDQARGTALRLLNHLETAGVDLAAVDPHLARGLAEGPAFFWARGEEQPPGEWRPSPATGDQQ